jgi:hypothetical protein
VPSSTWQGLCWLCQTWLPPQRRCCCPHSGQQRLEHTRSSFAPPVMPDNCTAPDRFLVESPHHYNSHGLTARLQLTVGLQRDDVVITAHHGFTSSRYLASGFTRVHPGVTGAHSDAVGPPGSFIRRTMAARSGALPYYNSTGGGSSSSAVVRRRTSSTSILHLHLHLCLRLLGHQVARPLQLRQIVVLGCARSPTGSRPGTSRPRTASAAVAAVPHPPVRGRPERDTKMRSGGVGRWI